jgi:alpha-L-rhamnosidase
MGWYSGEIGWGEKLDRQYGETNAALVEIRLFFSDGTTETVATGADWRARRSFVVDSEIYHGETQDFTASCGDVFKVRAAEYGKDKIVSQISEPCRVVERVKPVSYFVTSKGEKVLDFGQNLVGVIEFKIKGKRGQKVILRHAEALEDGNFYTENLRRARCTDTFILSGEEQVLAPLFTFHGFRYLEITGAEVIPEDYTALVIHSDMTPAGRLETANPLLNRLIENILWSQKGNFVDVPTDCPQRDERLGWTGDVNAFCRTATFNFNTALFFKKWLSDLRNDQRENGSIPNVIPDVLKTDAHFGSHTIIGTEAMWSSAAVMIPWKLYNIYGDVRFLKDNYDSMKRYIDLLLSKRGESGLIEDGHEYADWLSLDGEGDGSWSGDTARGGTNHYFLANAFCSHAVDLFSKIAAVLKKSADKKKYSAVFREHLKKIRCEYFFPSGRMITETQTACAVSLYFNIVPDGYRSKTVKALEKAMNRHNGKLVTGFIGTTYLCFALTDNGLHSYAEKLILNEEYPGWLYPVKLGATTIWERWNSVLENGNPNPAGMNSLNHYAYGAVGGFLWRRIAGIDFTAPGYKKIRLQPRPVRGLDKIYGEYESVYGTIACGYELKNDRYIVTCKIPPNTTADIILPDGKTETVGSGEYEFFLSKADTEKILLA